MVFFEGGLIREHYSYFIRSLQKVNETMYMKPSVWCLAYSQCPKNIKISLLTLLPKSLKCHLADLFNLKEGHPQPVWGWKWVSSALEILRPQSFKPMSSGPHLFMPSWMNKFCALWNTAVPSASDGLLQMQKVGKATQQFMCLHLLGARPCN